MVRITHHNSFPVKELALLLQEWHEKGNIGKIKKNLEDIAIGRLKLL